MFHDNVSTHILHNKLCIGCCWKQKQSQLQVLQYIMFRILELVLTRQHVYQISTTNICKISSLFQFLKLRVAKKYFLSFV